MSAGGCRSCVASGVANSGRRGRGVRALLGNRAALTWQRADLSVTVAFHSFGVSLLFVTFLRARPNWRRASESGRVRDTLL